MYPERSGVGPFPDAATGRAAVPVTGTACRVEPWREMLREHFVALDVSAARPAGSFRGCVRSTLVGHLSVAEVTSAAQTCRRTAGLLRTERAAYLQVGMVAAGRAVLAQDGRETELTPGAFAIYETDRPFTWCFGGPWRLLVLTWPRHLVELGAEVTRAATARSFGTDRLGRIVGHALADTVRSPPALSGADGRGLAAELAALVGTAAGERLRRDEVLTAPGAADLRARVDAYIIEHVEDPELAPEDIARAQFVSLRGLHRAFAAADTTVGALIRRRRLEHARRRLLDPRSAGLSLTEIAHASGFGDLPTFSRGFKIAYQESPSSYRRRGGAPTPEH